MDLGVVGVEAKALGAGAQGCNKADATKRYAPMFLSRMFLTL